MKALGKLSLTLLIAGIAILVVAGITLYSVHHHSKLLGSGIVNSTNYTISNYTNSTINSTTSSFLSPSVGISAGCDQMYRIYIGNGISCNVFDVVLDNITNLLNQTIYNSTTGNYSNGTVTYLNISIYYHKVFLYNDSIQTNTTENYSINSDGLNVSAYGLVANSQNYLGADMSLNYQYLGQNTTGYSPLNPEVQISTGCNQFEQSYVGNGIGCNGFVAVLDNVSLVENATNSTYSNLTSNESNSSLVYANVSIYYNGYLTNVSSIQQYTYQNFTVDSQILNISVGNVGGYSNLTYQWADLNLSVSAAPPQQEYLYCFGDQYNTTINVINFTSFNTTMTNSSVNQTNSTSIENATNSTFAESTIGSSTAVFSAPINSSGIGNWSIASIYPVPLYDAGCSIYNQTAYCVGTDGTTEANDSYYANLSTSGLFYLNQTSSYPIELTNAGCSIYNSTIYCVGTSKPVPPYLTGITPGYLNQTYYANVSDLGISQWQNTTSYPIPLAFTGCSIYQGYIYCVGSIGEKDGNLSYFASVSGSGIGNWIETTSYPANFIEGTCTTYDGYIYCLGGALANDLSSYYAPISGQGIGDWIKTTTFPSVVLFNAGCSVANGYIYCIGNQFGGASYRKYANMTLKVVSPGIPTLTVPPGIVYYVPITITNNQASPTTIPFQQMINVDSQSYESYEASNLQNVEFFYSDGTIIPSWLENNNSNTAQSSTYWLSLDKQIPANTANQIYMGFASTSTNLFDGVNVGEAPQLSPSYGEYDNGRYVFNFYDNFIGTTLNTSKWTQFTQGNGDVSVDNSITLNAAGPGSAAWLNFSAPQSTDNITVESLISVAGSQGANITDSFDHRYSGLTVSNYGLYTGNPDITPLNSACPASEFNSVELQYYFGDFSCIGSSYLNGDYEVLPNLIDQQSLTSGGQFTWSSLVPNYTSLYTNTASFNPGTTFSGGFGVGVPSDSADQMQTQSGTAVSQDRLAGSTALSFSGSSASPSGCSGISQVIDSYAISLTTPISTVAPFQQELVLDGANYPNLFSGWTNVVFSTEPCGVDPLYSWIQSGASSSAPQTIVWVKLPNGVSSSGTTIYMNLLSASGTAYSAGFAPNVSYTEDNGASVFTEYCDFESSLCGIFTAGIGGGGKYSESDGLTLGDGTETGSISSTFTVPSTGNYVMETYVKVPSGAAINQGASATCEGYSMDLGTSEGTWSEYATIEPSADGGCGLAKQYTTFILRSYNGGLSSATSFSTSASFDYYGNFIIDYATFGDNLDNFGMNVSGGVESTISNDIAIIPDLISLSGGNGPKDTVQWFMLRASPPVTGMPTVGVPTLIIPLTVTITAPTSPTTIDVNGHVAVTASGSGGTGTLTYSWAVANGDTCPGFSNPGNTGSFTYTGTAATADCQFIVTVTDQDSETASATTPIITVNSGIAVYVSPSSSISKDVGIGIAISASESGGTGPFSYSWTIPIGASCPGFASPGNTASFTYTGTSPTSNCQLTVTVTDQEDQQGSATSAIITINSGVGVTITAPTSPTSIDVNGNVQITTSTTGGTQPYSYSWSVANGYSCPGFGSGPGDVNSFTYTASSSTGGCEFTVIVTDSDMQTAQATTPTITVSGALSAPVLTPSNITLDAGQTETYTTSWAGGTSPYTIVFWNVTNINSPTEQNYQTIENSYSSRYTFITAATGTFSYYSSVTGSETTPVSYFSNTNVIIVNPALVASAAPTSNSLTIYDNQRITLTVSPPTTGTPPYTYQWYSGSSPSCTSDNLIPGATGTSYSTSVSTNSYYCVEETDSATTPESVYTGTTEVTLIPLSGTSQEDITWVRIRNTPPEGVMPSAAFGIITEYEPPSPITCSISSDKLMAGNYLSCGGVTVFINYISGGNPLVGNTLVEESGGKPPYYTNVGGDYEYTNVSIYYDGELTNSINIFSHSTANLVVDSNDKVSVAFDSASGAKVNSTRATFFAPISSAGIGSWVETTNYPVPFYGAYCTIGEESGGYLNG